MARPRFAGTVSFLLLVVGLCVPPHTAAAQTSFDRVFHVDADGGADDGSGTQAEPLRTIQEAMDRAQDNKNAGRSTRVVIAPGVYREAVEFAYSNYNGGGTSAAVVVEGAGPGETIIKGSEVFEGWQSEGGGVFSHTWTRDWGVADDPTGGRIGDRAHTPELVLRREMVFVDGERMQQVLSAGAMEPGTFRVDESADQLYLHPPTGVDPSTALVEVAVRAEGWTTRSEHNFSLRGLRVEHVATPWAYGRGAVVVSSSDDAVIEEVVARQNNFIGLSLQLNDNVQLLRSSGNHNGHSGWTLQKITDFVAEDTETSYNNWRGNLGGYTGWGPGNKSMSVHGMTVDGHRAIGNHSRGLWLDTDHKNALLTHLELRDNLKDGLFIEANQGPITLERPTITDNQGYAVLTANSENVTVNDGTLLENAEGALHITGAVDGRTITNFETGTTFVVQGRNWTVMESTLSQGASDGDLISTTYDEEAWGQFIDSLSSDYNTWWHPSRRDVFRWWTWTHITFEEWQERTGEDQHSVFADPESGTSAHHDIALREGWNYVSSPVQPRDSRLEEVFSGLLNVVSGVKDEDGDVFIPDGNTNSIGSWTMQEAYAVYATTDATLPLDGEKQSPQTELSLRAGWNLVPYLKEASMPVEEAFSPLTSKLVMVKDEVGRVYLPRRDIDGIHMLEPGQGYKVYVSEAATFTYPAPPSE